jgi:hypothetical protein
VAAAGGGGGWDDETSGRQGKGKGKQQGGRGERIEKKTNETT